MASKFAQPFIIPDEFPDILRNFTREVLRQQGKIETRENIYEYAVQYFNDLVQERDGKGSNNQTAVVNTSIPMYMKLDEVELQLLVRKFVLENTTEPGSNLMSLTKHKEVMEKLATELQLTKSESRVFYADAYEDADGMIHCNSYLALLYDALRQLRLDQPHRLPRIKKISEGANPVFIHGMIQEEFDALLLKVLQRADTQDVGILSRQSFYEALQDPDLGLSRREINILMSEAPISDNDEHPPLSVLYYDFVPLCFPALQDAFMHDIISISPDVDIVAQDLAALFAREDLEGRGVATAQDLVHFLRAADLGLTRLQALIVIADANDDMDGLINYEKFAIHAANMIHALVAFDTLQIYGPHLLAYRQSKDSSVLFEMDQDSFEDTLQSAFQTLDEAQSGLLRRDVLLDILSDTIPEITKRQLRTLLAIAEMDELGMMEYNSIIQIGFAALQKLQEYDYMIMQA